MAGYRSRSRSYSPRRRYSRSPPRYRHYDDPRDRYRGGGGGPRRGYDRPSAPTGLLVRNISLTARLEDIRGPFEQFGPIKDVYLPRNFHTKELRGFGFVKFRHPEDAAYAKQEMNHQVICGREITIVFAEENRKTPQEMRFRTRSSGRHMDGNYRRRQSLSRSPRSRYPSYSPEPSPVRRHSRFDLDALRNIDMINMLTFFSLIYTALATVFQNSNICVELALFIIKNMFTISPALLRQDGRKYI
ncbi:hypothetical protein VPH35_065750 [Triticum aestivum]